MISNSFRIVACAALCAAAVSQSAAAQTRNPAKKTSSSAPVTKTLTVVVLPVDSAPGDSVRAIVQRDLENGNRVTPAFVDPMTALSAAPFGRDSVDVLLLATAKAQSIVRITRHAPGFHASIYDAKTGLVKQSGDFPFPLVSEIRAQAIRDSLAQDLAAKTAATIGRLASDSITRDSLLRVNAGSSKKRMNGKERAAANANKAQRDLMVKAIEARRDTIFLAARRDTIVRDSMLPVLIAADSAAHFRGTRAFRLAVHAMSDQIEDWLTGTHGIAATRIAYVSGKNLHVVDSDGAVDEVIKTPGAPMSPSWHPAAKSIVYSDFTDSGTQIGEVDLSNGAVHLVAATPRGLNITPVYSPDGRYLVYGAGGERPADLVMYEVGSTLPPKPLSVGKYENSSPSFSPDGSRMVFMSPRPALTPQIFVMNADGTKVKLLTPFVKGKRSYRTGPDWSPTGDAVAYEQQNGDFQVWMINIKSGKMTQLTKYKENEDPSWAPDGRHMAITSTRGGGTRDIWVLDTKTGKFRQLTHVDGARLASWSPTLHLVP
ncbi:MAG: PD40 domain-containing protein [Gemmatimonadaceae bacterium]|nr:PD40 domain-containing protein [Gemmatimonadaceae bacterium]